MRKMEIRVKSLLFKNSLKNFPVRCTCFSLFKPFNNQSSPYNKFLYTALLADLI